MSAKRNIDDAKTGHIHLDVVGGIAGDMFIAAILDARPDLTEETIRAIRASGLPDNWTVKRVEGRDHFLTGSRLRIRAPGAPDIDEQEEHRHIQPRTRTESPVRQTGSKHTRPLIEHHHYKALTEKLRTAPLNAAVGKRALEILHLIAEAEADVHGVGIDEVALHEVGAVDSIADVVGAAYLIEKLSPATWSSSPLPVGGGFVEVAHGRIPVPAPATQLLLEGFTFVDDGVVGERITPTGAAILKHLNPSQRMQDRAFIARATGHGFGTRSLPGLANMLRARIYDAAPSPTTDGNKIAVIEFVVDDQTPEDLAAGIESIRQLDGVVDVQQVSTAGKKGRLGHLVQVLSRPNSFERVADSCLRETTTIGLRYRIEDRIVLARHERTTPIGVAVKIVERPDGQRTAKASLDDVKAKAKGQGSREDLRKAAETWAMEEGEDEQG